MIIIRFGICNGILGGWEFVPSWMNTILPYSIDPIYFITRHCTVNMVVAISIERLKALFSPLGSNPRCYSYILAVLFFSGKYDKIYLSWVLMAERSRAYVYDCCDATKTSPGSNPLATYEKEISLSTKNTVTELWVIEFVS